MSKWRYARYGILIFLVALAALTIVAITVNPVQFVALSLGAGFCIFMIYAILANWNDESEENATKYIMGGKEGQELCEEGQQLWDAVDYHKPNSFDDYRRHLLLCKECQKELELTKEDIKNIKDDIK